jgi:hypothetical protein
MLRTAFLTLLNSNFGLKNEHPQGRALRYRRFLLEIFAYAGEQIPRTPSAKRPKGQGIKPDGIINFLTQSSLP